MGEIFAYSVINGVPISTSPWIFLPKHINYSQFQIIEDKTTNLDFLKVIKKEASHQITPTQFWWKPARRNHPFMQTSTTKLAKTIHLILNYETPNHVVNDSESIRHKSVATTESSNKPKMKREKNGNFIQILKVHPYLITHDHELSSIQYTVDKFFNDLICWNCVSNVPFACHLKSIQKCLWKKWNDH